MLFKNDVPITNFAYWIEDGYHCVRATDFDVQALDKDSVDSAVAKLGESLEDLVLHLADIPSEDRTEGEVAVMHRLIERFSPAFLKFQRQFLDAPFMRRVATALHPAHIEDWEFRDLSKLGTSDKLLHA